MCRSTVLFMNLREERRQQAVTAHAEEHTALTEQSDHNHGTITEKDSHDNGTVQPWIGRGDDSGCISRTHVVDGYGYWSNALLTGKLGVVCHARHDMGKEDIKHGTHQ